MRIYRTVSSSTLPLTVWNSHAASFTVVKVTSPLSLPLVVLNSTGRGEGSALRSRSCMTMFPLLVSASTSAGRMSSVRSMAPLTLSASSFCVRTLPPMSPLVVDREISPALAA